MEHVTLPSGRISESGIIAIKNLLLSKTNNYDGLPTDWVWQMQVGGKGEYVGSLPKRIAKYYWQKHNVKFDSDFLGTLGSLSAGIPMPVSTKATASVLPRFFI